MKFLLCALLSMVVPNVVLADPCVDQIPLKLQQLLRQRFNDERLPISTDSAEDNHLEASKEGKCLLEARMDLDGDGRKDFVLVMPSVKTPLKYRLVAAMRKPDGWILATIAEENGEFATLAVNRAPPGLYVHTNDYAFVPEPGVLERFRSKNDGFYLGAVEGAADAYFLNNGGWIHVHSID